jgi:hypothetical protein
VKNHFSTLLATFFFLPLFLICKIVIAEEFYSQRYQFQITTTSIGYGFWLGAFIETDLMLGVQFTNHSTSFTKEEDFEHSIDQESQVIVAFNRWNPLKENNFYLQSGIAHRKQYEDTVYRRDHYEGEALVAYGRFGSVRVVWPRWAANFGLGWHWRSNLGFSGGVGYGIIWSEAPKITTDSTYDWFVTEAEEKYFHEEQQQTKDRLNQLAIWPLYSASIGWTF